MSHKVKTTTFHLSICLLTKFCSESLEINDIYFYFCLSISSSIIFGENITNITVNEISFASTEASSYLLFNFFTNANISNIQSDNGFSNTTFKFQNFENIYVNKFTISENKNTRLFLLQGTNIYADLINVQKTTGESYQAIDGQSMWQSRGNLHVRNCVFSGVLSYFNAFYHLGSADFDNVTVEFSENITNLFDFQRSGNRPSFISLRNLNLDLIYVLNNIFENSNSHFTLENVWIGTVTGRTFLNVIVSGSVYYNFHSVSFVGTSIYYIIDAVNLVGGNMTIDSCSFSNISVPVTGAISDEPSSEVLFNIHSVESDVSLYLSNSTFTFITSKNRFILFFHFFLLFFFANFYDRNYYF